jgi:hypothetical protein
VNHLCFLAWVKKKKLLILLLIANVKANVNHAKNHPDIKLLLLVHATSLHFVNKINIHRRKLSICLESF